MVSQMWLDAVSGMAQTWGLSNTAMLYIAGFMLVIGVSLGVGLTTKNKEYSLGAFFVMFFLETLMGIFDWIIFLIIILPVAFLEYKNGAFMRGNNNG